MSDSEAIAESWISAYCSLMGHEYFVEVSEEFIEDDFNLTGLQSQVHMFKDALELILDVEPEDEDDEEEDEYDEDEGAVVGNAGYRRGSERSRHGRANSDLSVIESSAELLYGLIHQRYITSRQGIQHMLEKYEQQHFGVCPRVHCNGCRVLPVGRTDTPGLDTVKLYCPSCQDLYTPPNSRFHSVDGAFFGTTFGPLFFMTFPELDIAARTDNAASSTNNSRQPSLGSPATNATNATNASSLSPNQPTQVNGVVTTNLAPGLGQGKIYEPRIYGFKVAERSRSGPRMKWLRMKPNNVSDLDETAFHEEQNRDIDDEANGDGDGDAEMANMDAQQATIARRRKAPMRRRRPAPSGRRTDAMNLNGTGEAG